MSNAKRFNEGKIDFTLIPVDAQEAEARVWMSGEKKYGRNNWQKLWGDDTVNTVLKSMLRHTNAIQAGAVRDKESGEYHAAHIRANAAMLIRYYNEQENDSISDEDIPTREELSEGVCAIQWTEQLPYRERYNVGDTIETKDGPGYVIIVDRSDADHPYHIGILGNEVAGGWWCYSHPENRIGYDKD